MTQIITELGFPYAISTGKLEISVEAQNLNHARFLYDMLVPLTPILIALSAASPIYQGHFADVDHSFDIFQQATDGRIVEERDPVNA